MFSDKLKKLIVEYLLKDLMPVEIIYYRDSIWFINREQRYWYFEYHKEDKHLWWRWSHFQSALTMFSLNGEEHQYLFGELVNMILNKKQNLETKYPDKVFKTVGSILNFKEDIKETLNCEVNTTGVRYFNGEWRVDEALNCEVKKTLSGGSKKSMEAHKVLDQEVKTASAQKLIKEGMVEEVLNFEVETTISVREFRQAGVEEILNHEVETTICGDSSLFGLVEEVLNHEVKTTVKVQWAQEGLVEEVLNHDVKTTGEAYHNDDYVTEEILNNTIDTYDSGELVDEEKLINNVLNYGTDTIEINSIERMKGESPFQDIVVSHILDESEKVTDKLKIKEDDRVKSYSCDVFMCDFLVQNVLEIGSNSINFDVTSQQGRVDGVLKNS
jgi:hypothetical protein